MQKLNETEKIIRYSSIKISIRIIHREGLCECHFNQREKRLSLLHLHQQRAKREEISN